MVVGKTAVFSSAIRPGFLIPTVLFFSNPFLTKYCFQFKILYKLRTDVDYFNFDIPQARWSNTRTYELDGSRQKYPLEILSEPRRMPEDTSPGGLKNLYVSRVAPFPTAYLLPGIPEHPAFLSDDKRLSSKFYKPGVQII